MPTGNLLYHVPITNVPHIVRSNDASVHAFLAGLSPVNFLTIADPKGIWAVLVANAGEGTAASSGSAWVVSDECYRRLAARRYSQSGQ
jgi:hypothetical protein